MAFKRCSIGTKCAKKVCQENFPHTITPPPSEPLRQGRMIHAFMFFTPNSDPTPECSSKNRDSSDQATFLQSSFVQFWWVCVNCILRVLFLSDRSGTGVVFCCWSPSASGFDVLCVQRCILYNLVVTSGYLCYCCLSIISNQSAHSPLTSDINKTFSSTQLPLTGYFLFFGPFSVNPRDGCVWKSQ